MHELYQCVRMLGVSLSPDMDGVAYLLKCLISTEARNTGHDMSNRIRCTYFVVR